MSALRGTLARQSPSGISLFVIVETGMRNETFSSFLKSNFQGV